MSLCRILVDSFADEGLTNAQMTNAREIVRRLDPSRFHVTIFHVGSPDERIRQRPNTRLLRLPKQGQTIQILREFVRGGHKILFYMKASPASRIYQGLRNRWRDRRITLGTVESHCDLRCEPTIAPEAVRLWEQTILRCDQLFSNSPAVARSLKAEYGYDSEVVPTGVDTNFFTPGFDCLSHERPRVLFVGSLRPFKQPQILLEAAARFPDADFVLAGDGEMAPAIKERVKRENLINVFLAGTLLPDALRTEYRNADIFLFPSKWEGSPKVILEAAACSLPVIARRDYQPETVIHGKTGYLVDSDEELFACLHQLLFDADLRRRLGSAGRKLSQKFDWEIITRRWEEIFLATQMQHAKAHVA